MTPNPVISLPLAPLFLAEEVPHLLFYLGAVLVSLLGSLVLIWIIVAVRVLVSSRGMTTALNNFFAAIVNSNYGAAYGMLTPELQGELSAKDFKEFVKTQGLRQYKRLELPLVEVEAGRCPLDLTVELQTGQMIDLTLDLVRVEKTWLIDGLAMGKSAETSPKAS